MISEYQIVDNTGKVLDICSVLLPLDTIVFISDESEGGNKYTFKYKIISHQVIIDKTTNKNKIQMTLRKIV